MHEYIEHEGIVVAVSQTTVRVRIERTDACSSCKVKGSCMSANSRVKEMDVRPLETLHVGDKVVVMVTEKAGWRAIALAYIMPFVVLIGVVMGLTRAGWSEALVGTIGLVSVGVYYAVLWRLKGRFDRAFVFTAIKAHGNETK